MFDDMRYKRWLADRRRRDADVDLADRIMDRLSVSEDAALLVERNTPQATWMSSVCVPLAACVVALMVGISPFVYLLFVSFGVAF